VCEKGKTTHVGGKQNMALPLPRGKVKGEALLGEKESRKQMPPACRINGEYYHSVKKEVQVTGTKGKE